MKCQYGFRKFSLDLKSPERQDYLKIPDIIEKLFKKHKTKEEEKEDESQKTKNDEDEDDNKNDPSIGG